jgi:hypothetical protein
MIHSFDNSRDRHEARTPDSAGSFSSRPGIDHRHRLLPRRNASRVAARQQCGACGKSFRGSLKVATAPLSEQLGMRTGSDELDGIVVRKSVDQQPIVADVTLPAIGIAAFLRVSARERMILQANRQGLALFDHGHRGDQRLQICLPVAVRHLEVFLELLDPAD